MQNYLKTNSLRQRDDILSQGEENEVYSAEFEHPSNIWFPMMILSVRNVPKSSDHLSAEIFLPRMQFLESHLLHRSFLSEWRPLPPGFKDVPLPRRTQAEFLQALPRLQQMDRWLSTAVQMRSYTSYARFVSNRQRERVLLTLRARSIAFKLVEALRTWSMQRTTGKLWFLTGSSFRLESDSGCLAYCDDPRNETRFM